MTTSLFHPNWRHHSTVKLLGVMAHFRGRMAAGVYPTLTRAECRREALKTLDMIRRLNTKAV